MGGLGPGQQPGFLGQERVHPVTGDDDGCAQLGPVTVGAHADHTASRVLDQTGGYCRGDQSGPSIGGFTSQPGVEVAAQRGHAVVGGGSPGLGSEVDGERLRARHHHGGAPDHPSLDRYLLPPVGNDVVEDPPVDDASVYVLGSRERAAFHQHHRSARSGQGQGGGCTGRAGADHYSIELDLLRHGSPQRFPTATPSRQRRPRPHPNVVPTRLPGRRHQPPSRGRPWPSWGTTDRY